MAKAHDRIVELNITGDCVGHNITVNGVKYYRRRDEIEDGNGFAITIDNTAAQPVANPPEVNLGELLPPPTVLRIVSTGI